MRKVGFRVVLFTSWLATAIALTACAAETEPCAEVSGKFQPLYVEMPGGTCGPITNPYSVPLEDSRSGVVMKVETLSTGNVITDVVMKGCTLRLTQTVQEDGVLTSEIHGDPIHVESETALRGMVQVRRFDETSAEVCRGTYQAEFTKGKVISGGAAL